MTVNLITNVRQAVTDYEAPIHRWLDSTVVLYWINNQGEFRQFVANRVQTIRRHENVIWHYVPTGENPVDVGSWGGNINHNDLWKHGPPWLSDPAQWLAQGVLESTPESQAEAKVVREIFKVAIVKEYVLDQLLQKHSLLKVLRITAWVRRFIANCKRETVERKTAHMDSHEVREQREWWIRRAQNTVKDDQQFHVNRKQLNRQENNVGILECRGLIIGEYPVYIPDIHPFASFGGQYEQLIGLLKSLFYKSNGNGVC